MPTLPTTIDEVLEALNDIVQETIEHNNYLGIFAYVYRRTTVQIKQAVENEEFDDNLGMQEFDVLFANLYIKSYYDFKAGKKTTAAWELSFHAKNDPILIMQHLILGMNAHINMDLGVAAAIYRPGNQIHGFKKDFMKVNQILQELVEEMQDRITKVSPLMFLLDWLGNGKDEIVAGFSIKKTRDFAWTLAQSICMLPDEASQKLTIQEADHFITSIGKIVHRPPGKWLIPKVLLFVKRFEEQDVAEILRKLRA